MPRFLFSLFFLFFISVSYGQAGKQDTSVVTGKDTSAILIKPKSADTLLSGNNNDTTFTHNAIADTFDNILYFKDIPQWKQSPEIMIISEKTSASKDPLFYFLIGLVLIFAMIKILFPKYVDNMFTIFFQANFRRQQTKEQLQQDTFPALLMNLFFIVVSASFIAQSILLLDITNQSFWITGMHCSLVLIGVMLIKYLFTKIVGLLFGFSSVTKQYLFTGYLINKILGVILLPVVFLLSFCNKSQGVYFIICGLVITCISLLIRYSLSYKRVHRNLKINPLQFFVYLCVIEFVPFLVFYEVILNLFRKIGYNF